MGSLTTQVPSRRARASRRRGDFSKSKPPTTKEDVGVFENGYYIVPKDVSLGTTVEFFANAAPKSTTVAQANSVYTHEKKGSAVSACASSPSKTTTTKVRRSNTLPAPHVQKNQGSSVSHSKSPLRRQNETVELLSPNFFENFEPLPEDSTDVNKHHLNKIYSEPHLPKITVQSPSKPLAENCAIKSPQEQKTPTKSKTSTSPTHWAGGAYMNSPAPKLLPMPDFDDDDDDDSSSDGTTSDTPASKSSSSVMIVHKSASEPSTPSISRAPSPSSPEGPVLQQGAQSFPLGYMHPILPVPFHLPPTQYAYFPLPPHSYPVSPPLPHPSSQHLSCGSYARYGGY